MVTARSDSYAAASGGGVFAGISGIPAWVPAAGASAQIGYAQGAHPESLAATLEEIGPQHMPWAVTPGSDAPWTAGSSKNIGSVTNWCGGAWDSVRRRFYSQGSGHGSLCIPSYYYFDVPSLAFAWAEIPLPTDGLLLAAEGSKSAIDAAYTNGEFDTDESVWLGGSTTWPLALRQSGVIQPEIQHTQYGLVFVPGTAAGNTNGIIVNCCIPTGRFGGAIDLNQRTYFDLDDNRSKLTANFRITTAVGYYAGAACYFAGTVERVFALMHPSSTQRSTIQHMNPATRTWAESTATADIDVVYGCGGLHPHPDSGLLITFLPSNSAGVTTVTGAGGEQFRMKAVSAAAVVAGSHTWRELAYTNAGGTWPISKIDAGGGSFREMFECLGACYCPRNACFYIFDWRYNSTKLWKVTPSVPMGSTMAEYLDATWAISEESFTGPIPCVNDSGAAVASIYPYNRLVWDEASGCLIGIPPYYLQAPFAIRPVGV